jgi:putative peptidoglycan lipid II flippase
MTLLTLVSRLTGLVRVLVVAAVLGTTFLGNTFQSANSVSNLVFELFAAGALQAAMIPTLVELSARGDDAEAAHVAGSLLGLAIAVLGAVAAAGMVAAPWIMRALVAGVEAPDVRAAQVRLGTTLLWFFLPQVVLYAAGAVATGVLNAQGRFALPVAAPIANNVVVVAACAMFWRLRDGAPPGLDLTGAQTVVLGLGATLGVLALSAIPLVAVVRSGFSLRPRIDLAHPGVRRVLGRGGWAALFLVGTQALLGVVLVLANGVEGGVVVYQVAYTLFLVPHALFTMSVLTALFPSLARFAAAADPAGYARAVAAGLATIAFVVLPAAAALVALAGPLTRVLLFGESASAATSVAAALIAFAPGLAGYGAFVFLARALDARGDTRTAALVHLAVVAVAAAAMVVLAPAVDGSGRVVVLAGVHSGAYLVGAAVLGTRVGATLPPDRPAVARPLAVGAAAAVAAGGAMWGAQQPFDLTGRGSSVVAVAVAGGLGLAVYLGVRELLGADRPSQVVARLRRAEVPGG